MKPRNKFALTTENIMEGLTLGLKNYLSSLLKLLSIFILGLNIFINCGNSYAISDPDLSTTNRETSRNISIMSQILKQLQISPPSQKTSFEKSSKIEQTVPTGRLCPSVSTGTTNVAFKVWTTSTTEKAHIVPLGNCIDLVPAIYKIVEESDEISCKMARTKILSQQKTLVELSCTQLNVQRTKATETSPLTFEEKNRALPPPTF